MNRQILVGDVLEQLRNIPERTIDCVITSPPYWGLRDYNIEGQWGLESDFKQYLEKMQNFMECLKRVLKDTGTVWINLGDSYSSIHTGGHKSELSTVGANRPEAQEFRQTKAKILQEKSRCGVPERFYISCIDNGWIARNHIPWYKSNSMPSSVKDRFTNKWESIFFFAKQQRYYFNLDAVRQKAQTETKPFNVRVRDTDKDRFLQKALDSEVENHNEKGERKSDHIAGQTRQSIAGHNANYDEDGNDINHPKGKNPGDVFFINPRPFPEAHFATFPVGLPLRILKCACPPDGIVLDPFFGAGTVGLAAEKLGLNWMGIELNQKYVDIARQRLSPLMNERLFQS